MNNQDTNISISFELHSLCRDIIRNLWLVVLAGIIAWMGIYVAERSIYTPEYTSRAVLVVRSRVGTSGQYTNLSVSSEMAKIFTEVFCQPSMKRLAAENLGYSSFSGSVSASVIGDTNLMNLSVTSSDPEQSYFLLCSILEVYPNISEAVFTNSVIDIISSPQMPSSPSNTISSQRREQFVLLAMAAEFCAVILFSLLRSTIKTEQMFHERIDANLLGTVTHEKPHLSLKERLLHTKRALLSENAYASLRFTEDYQKIANRLEYVHTTAGSQVFAITSVAENEGKSTAAANIALALSSRGNRVMLLDLDTRKPSIHKILECHNTPGSDLAELLSGESNSRSFVFLRYRQSNLMLALTRKGSKNSAEWIGGQRIKAFLGQIRDKTDYIIIDTPPTSVSADAMYISAIADKTVLVVRTDRVAEEDINDTVLTIGSSGGSLLGCILNDVYKPFTLFGQIGSDEYGIYVNGMKDGYGSSYARFNSDYDVSDIPMNMGDDKNTDE